MEKELTYPMRINKYLAHKNIVSRREADRLIESGKVFINGQRAKLGDKVEKNDKVETAEWLGEGKIYVAFNKPVGVITHSPQGEEKEILDIVKFQEKIFPVGRLDKDSHGLIILTNDGRITDKLLNPEFDHDKEYEVKLNKDIRSGFVRSMENGIVLEDGYKTKKSRVKKIDENVFTITLTEGKKRQIRRMVTALGYEVTSLKRTRIMNVKLGSLTSGKYRVMKGKELEKFLESLGL